MKKIILSLNSNIDRYKIDVYGCNEHYSKVVRKTNECVCICTFSQVIRIVLTPLRPNYNSTLYYYFDTSQNNRYCLSFNFSKPTISPIGLFTFYLTDKNYGLKLKGNLYFSSI